MTDDQGELFKMTEDFNGRVHFDGPAYEAECDQVRLMGQIKAIYDFMKDGQWRTLGEIEAATGYPQASISAQLRHLRKDKFGAHQTHKQRRGDANSGLWEYSLEVRHEC